MSDARIEGLRQALAQSPGNHPLRQMLAEALLAAGRVDEGLAELTHLCRAEALGGAEGLSAARLALLHGDLDLAGRCLASARRAGVVEGVAELQSQLDARLAEHGVLLLVRGGAAKGSGAEVDTEASPRVTFADVGGLEAVKQLVNRRIVLPFQRPELYERYGRSSGGGVLLYGPPGCGKTLLARATAGECGVEFLNVRIEEILDP